MCMFKGRSDKDKEIISDLEDRSEDVISKEVQRSKGQKEIWGRIRNMEDRVNVLISYAEIEGSENVTVNNIWLPIAWKYSITDGSPWWIDIKVQGISSRRDKKKFTPVYVAVKDRYKTTEGGRNYRLTLKEQHLISE